MFWFAYTIHYVKDKNSNKTDENTSDTLYSIIHFIGFLVLTYIVSGYLEPHITNLCELLAQTTMETPKQ